MKTVVDWPDVERLVVDLIDTYDLEPTIGIGVPSAWTPDDGLHIQVALDGTPVVNAPVSSRSTVRVVAWSGSTTDSKDLAGILQGLLHAHAGGDGITAILPLTGTLPARDPDTGAELASFTVAVVVRSEPVGS